MIEARRPVVAALLGLAVALGAAARPAAAQTPQDSTHGPPVELEALEVKPARAAVAGGVTVVRARVDSLRVPPAPTLEQVMRALPLVQVRTNSRGEAQFSLRGSGSDARQVAVLVDGIPLSLGWDDRADLSLLPASAVQSVRLSRGLPSVLFGPNVLGGVVELDVARSEESRPARSLLLATGVDHAGGRTIAAGAMLPFRAGDGNGVLRAGGGYRARSGVPRPGSVAEPEPAADLRLNSDLEHADAFVSLRYEAAAGAWLSLASSGFTAERGVPAELHVEAPRFWRYPVARRLFSVVSGGTGDRATPLGRGDLEASLGVDLGRTEIDSYADRAYDDVVAEEDADDRTLTLRLLGDHTLGSRGELRAALTLADIRHDERLDPGGAALYRQRLLSVGAETAWRVRPPPGFAGARVMLGVAYDAADTPASGDKPPLEPLSAWGGRLGLAAGSSRLLLHAGLSRRDRFPSLRELYSGALGRFLPNPALRPERLLAAEAGATTRIGSVELQTAVFHHRLSDAIVRVSAPERKFQRVNRDEVRATGLELLADAPLGAASLSGDLVLQRVRLLDPTAGADARPEYQPALHGGVGVRLPLARALQATADARFAARQFCVHPDSGDDVALPGSARLDLGFSRTWALRRGWLSTLEASAVVDNVTDAASYDQCGLPQPGRLFRVGVRVR